MQLLEIKILMSFKTYLVKMILNKYSARTGEFLEEDIATEIFINFQLR